MLNDSNEPVRLMLIMPKKMLYLLQDIMDDLVDREKPGIGPNEILISQIIHGLSHEIEEIEQLKEKDLQISVCKVLDDFLHGKGNYVSNAD